MGADPARAADLEQRNESLRAQIAEARELLDKLNSSKGESEAREQLKAQLKKTQDQVELYKRDNEKTRKALAMLTR